MGSPFGFVGRNPLPKSSRHGKDKDPNESPTRLDVRRPRPTVHGPSSSGDQAVVPSGSESWCHSRPRSRLCPAARFWKAVSHGSLRISSSPSPPSERRRTHRASRSLTRGLDAEGGRRVRGRRHDGPRRRHRRRSAESTDRGLNTTQSSAARDHTPSRRLRQERKEHHAHSWRHRLVTGHRGCPRGHRGCREVRPRRQALSPSSENVSGAHSVMITGSSTRPLEVGPPSNRALPADRRARGGRGLGRLCRRRQSRAAAGFDGHGGSSHGRQRRPRPSPRLDPADIASIARQSGDDAPPI
jgi:hypothetical protein